MAKKFKKILTLDELFLFCQTQNFTHFSSKDSGYQLAVSVPTTFEVDDNVDEAHRGMMKLKVKMFHDGINRNGSKIPHNSAEKAMKTIPDRPVLAAIHQLDNGEWDFEAHEMEFVENEDGEIEINYIEKQVGSYSSEPAFWEHDEKLNKDFVCAYAYIPKDYTKACEIIERKKGTKNSVELSIDELAFDTKDKCLVLEEFYVSGSTLLGAHSDGTEIEEGMLGSRADIVEFSKDVNSAFYSSEEKIITMLEELNNKISNLDKNSKEGGNLVSKFEELLAKYGKTVEDIDFDYEGLSDEELEAKFAELFADDSDTSSSEDDTDSSTDSDDTSTSDSDTSDSDSDLNSDSDSDSTDERTVPSGSIEDDDETDGTTSKKKIDESFELSLQEKVQAISSLVSATYEEEDNEWYHTIVYDDYVVMIGYFEGRCYKQNYKVENDEYMLVGDRIQVYIQYLTQEEIDTLEEMKSNYSALVEFKNKAEKLELDSLREDLFNDERFNIIKETEEYKALVVEAEKYSIEELETKLKLIVADYALGNGNFSKFNEQSSGRMFRIPNKAENVLTSKYGGIFTDKE